MLRAPSIAAKLAYDGHEPGFVKHPLVRYVGAYDGSRIVGVIIALDVTRYETEVHIAFLPAALRDGRHLARRFLASEFRRPDLMRVTAMVLSTLPSAANFCRRIGFCDEGVRREAVRIGGKPVDVLLLGMTRADAIDSFGGGKVAA